MSETREHLLEISASLAEISAMLKQNEGKTGEAIRSAMSEAALEIGGPIADIEESIKRNGAGVADALKALLQIAARPVQVTVEAPETPPVLAPAPAHEPQALQVVLPAPAGWTFDVEYNGDGAIKRLVARRFDA